VTLATVPSFGGEARLQEALAEARPWSRCHNPRWARAGPDELEACRDLQWHWYPGGGGDDLAGSQDGGSAASLLQHGDRSFTGPYGPQSGLTGPGVLPLLCPVSDCLSAMEVGSSHVAARLLFLVSTVSCISVVQAASQCHKETGDGDFKIMVAHASGWRC
jgi:hypothetical protein